METSKIAVDLRARTFEIDVPHDKVNSVLDRLEEFFSLPVPSDSGGGVATANRSSEEENRSEGDPGGVSSDEKPSSPRKRSKTASKPRSYDLVDLGLQDAERQKIRDVFAAKAPSQQSDMVAVIGLSLKTALKKAEFTPNEIHSVLKIVNKPTPKNLLAVFGNMKRDGIADYNDGKILINSLTEDYVNFHMENKKNGKKK